ncbi:hypothetical protein ABK040_004065 [Willaertia magna]
MSSGHESNVVINDVKQSKAYIGGHSFAGITSFILTKGVLLVPIQNLKTKQQILGKDLLLNKNQLFNGLNLELIIQFLNFGTRVLTNSLCSKYLNIVSPTLSSVVGNVIVLPLVRKRLLNICELSDTNNNHFYNWKQIIYKSLPYLLYGILEDGISTILYQQFSENDFLNNLFNLSTNIYNERLVQSFILGCVKALLCPLEVLYKKSLIGYDSKKGKEKRDMYRGIGYGFIEAFCLIYLKYSVYKLTSTAIIGSE